MMLTDYVLNCSCCDPFTKTGTCTKWAGLTLLQTQTIAVCSQCQHKLCGVCLYTFSQALDAYKATTDGKEFSKACRDALDKFQAWDSTDLVQCLLLLLNRVVVAIPLSMNLLPKISCKCTRQSIIISYIEA